MSVTLGTGAFTYEALDEWAKLPDGWTLKETPGVAVDSQDRVFAFTRGEHPLIVFDREGNFLRSFGEGLFTPRTHGLFIGPDDSVYCVDDGHHTVTQFSPEGKLLLTIGSEDKPADKWSGLPFNRPDPPCGVAEDGLSVYQRRLWELAGAQVHAGRTARDVLGRARRGPGAVLPAPQRGHRCRRQRVCGGPGESSGAGVRRGRQVPGGVAQHPPAGRDDAGAGPEHVHWGAERFRRRAGAGVTESAS